MLTFRQIPINITRQLAIRYFSKKAQQSTIKMNLNKGAFKQVHQETLRHVNPCSRINICSAIYLKVCSADVHEYPDGDVFIAELHGGHVKNCPVEMRVQVGEGENEVNVEISKILDINSDFHCELFVPIRSELYIYAEKDVNVGKIYSRAVHVNAGRNINIKDIRADTITISSQHGDVRCTGLLLGENTLVEASNLGNVYLDKLQGYNFSCKTEEGNICVNSCYSEVSKFETDTGKLNLQNVHKKTEVIVNKEGQLNMIGVHGNINIRSKARVLNVQLSELVGQSTIIADNTEDSVINISDEIEKNAYIEIDSSNITLEKSLAHLSDCISSNNKCFQTAEEHRYTNKLLISSKGTVKLGKQSWVETMQALLEK